MTNMKNIVQYSHKEVVKSPVESVLYYIPGVLKNNPLERERIVKCGENGEIFGIPNQMMPPLLPDSGKFQYFDQN